MPNVIIIAGPNGAGKSTAAPILLQGILNFENFINADVLAQGLCAFHPESAAISAGRIMLGRIHELGANNESFAFETTLASRSFYTQIRKLKQRGYQFHLIFLWLSSVEIAMARVQARVSMGGHSIPADTIIRRYTSGLKNFFQLYTTIATSWSFYDNSKPEHLDLIASFSDGVETIFNPTLWNPLKKEYHCA